MGKASIQIISEGKLVSGSNPLPVTLDAPAAGYTFVDRSGTITSGTVSQVVAAAATGRSYLLFTNDSDTDMWLNFGVAAVALQPSIKIAANGGFYEPLSAPAQSINVICATTGKTFVCKEVV